MTSRREFLRQLGGGAAGAMLPIAAARTAFEITPPAGDVKFGYAAITWGGDDQRAIDEIAALGFPGIQLRSNVLTQYADKPAALRDILARHRLTFVALSSGNVSIDLAAEASVVAEHASHARFLRDAGGLYLQLIDERPKGRDIEAGDYARLGTVLTEIGRRAADYGVQAAYHHHAGSIGEKPEAIDRILEASDPKYVKLLLDVAHYRVGGGDPAAAIRRYHDRILFLHIKDVRLTAGSFRFVELGKGVVDLPGVFKALHDVGFRGWAVVELDSVPDRADTPKDAALANKKYLEGVLGVRVS